MLGSFGVGGGVGQSERHHSQMLFWLHVAAVSSIFLLLSILSCRTHFFGWSLQTPSVRLCGPMSSRLSCCGRLYLLRCWPYSGSQCLCTFGSKVRMIKAWEGGLRRLFHVGPTYPLQLLYFSDYLLGEAAAPKEPRRWFNAALCRASRQVAPDRELASRLAGDPHRRSSADWCQVEAWRRWVEFDVPTRLQQRRVTWMEIPCEDRLSESWMRGSYRVLVGCSRPWPSY